MQASPPLHKPWLPQVSHDFFFFCLKACLCACTYVLHPAAAPAGKRVVQKITAAVPTQHMLLSCLLFDLAVGYVAYVRFHNLPLSSTAKQCQVTCPCSLQTKVISGRPGKTLLRLSNSKLRPCRSPAMVPRLGLILLFLPQSWHRQP